MIVAFVGPKHSGKSTAAKLLMKRGFQLKPFAKPIKDMLRAIGVPEECLTGDRKEEPLEMLSGRSARYAMQKLGEEWGRQEMHPDFWVNLLRHYAMIALKNASRDVKIGGRTERIIRPEDLIKISFVMDDMRYPNEREAVKKLDGIIIRIEREGYEHSEDHPSEKHVLEADYVLQNDGTIQDLWAKVQAVTS